MQTRRMWTLVVAAALVTAACGDSKSSLLPTAPSSLSADSTSVAANTPQGHAASMGNGPKPGNGNGAATGSAAGEKVEFEGLVDAVDAGSITVNDQVVAVTSATVIRHGSRVLRIGDVRPRDRVHVRANRSGSALEAIEIKLQNPGEGDVPAPAPPPDPNQVVSVVAVDNTANETGAAGTNTGAFRLSRTGTLAQLEQTLTVSFSLNGTSTPGIDYVLPTSATFGPNQSTLDLTLTPVSDAADSPETAVLTLTAGATYDVGSPASATITITDDPLPQVAVSATRPSAMEGGSNGRFVLTRTGSSASRLQVTVRFSGSATNGSGTWSPENAFDYSLPTTVEFEPGSLMLTLNVIAVADGVSEPLETVEITVLPGDLYELGTATATVTITSSN